MAVEIPLTRGLVALVDAADADWLNQWKWCAINGKRGLFYAYRECNGRGLLMHRLLIGARPGQLVDHHDTNTLNNRRGNLRVANHSLNAANRGPSRRNALGVKGVYKAGNRFIALICVRGRSIRLGSFVTLEDASSAYQLAAAEHFGEFARVA